MKILHIANWYPNCWDFVEGIFVKKQYIVFSEVTDAKLINVQVRFDKFFFKYIQIDYSENEKGFYILTRIKSFRIIEILSTLLLIFALLKSKFYKYNALNFHIAYPLLTYYLLWKHLIKKPIFISEHWTAYHMSFNLPMHTNKLDRIKSIFKQKIPVITVSKALLRDIQNFSESTDFPSTVIPNVIDKTYRYNKKVNNVPTFFIVNVWRPIKNPFCMLEAFSELSNKGVDFNLKIGGYGELLDEMKTFVKNKKLESKITFLGKMSQERIENELNECDAYLFSSKYETFSVACADALSCGCPIIGPPIPCILEYASSEEMITIKDDTSMEWEKGILFFIKNKGRYNREKIAKKNDFYFSNMHIKELYLNFLNENFK